MIEVSHNRQKSRFEYVENGNLAVLDYQERNGQLALTHTGVPDEIAGGGIGGALVKAAFDHARAHGLKVLPLCSFAAAWLARHPDYEDLRAGS
ncbi:MAG: N-acetyltransferase [Bryobacteraceae bacterium]|nr:N-acetyltransferase [Bryobacteraceae bacterium]